jgi:hypothetical protein
MTGRVRQNATVVVPNVVRELHLPAVPSEKHHQSPEVRAFGELRLQTICSFICLSLFDIAPWGGMPHPLVCKGAVLDFLFLRRDGPPRKSISQFAGARRLPPPGTPRPQATCSLARLPASRAFCVNQKSGYTRTIFLNNFPGVYSRLKPSIVQTRNSTEIAVKIVTVKPLKK